jgi:transcriptional antiterminator NusG
MGELSWYVVRSISGQEKKVKEYLETEVARAKMVEFIPEILIPMEKVYEVRNGKKRVRERNFFPGYILVSADLSNGEVEHLVKSIPGVLGFLGDEGGANKKAVPLRQSEVNRILGKVGDVEQGEVAVDAEYFTGETIKVTDGPFSGFTGTIQEVFEDKKKLNVVVKIFGRSTPVELNYIQVEKEQ